MQLGLAPSNMYNILGIHPPPRWQICSPSHLLTHRTNNLISSCTPACTCLPGPDSTYLPTYLLYLLLPTFTMSHPRSSFGN